MQTVNLLIKNIETKTTTQSGRVTMKLVPKEQYQKYSQQTQHHQLMIIFTFRLVLLLFLSLSLFLLCFTCVLNIMHQQLIHMILILLYINKFRYLHSICMQICFILIFFNVLTIVGIL